MTDILGPTRTTLRLAEDWAIDRKAHSRFVNVIPLYIELAPIYGIPAENGAASRQRTGLTTYRNTTKPSSMIVPVWRLTYNTCFGMQGVIFPLVVDSLIPDGILSPSSPTLLRGLVERGHQPHPMGQS